MSGVCNKPQQVTMLSPPYQRPKVLPPCGGASARCRGRLTPLLVAGHLSTATRSSERPRQQTIRPHPPDPPPRAPSSRVPAGSVSPAGGVLTADGASSPGWEGSVALWVITRYGAGIPTSSSDRSRSLVTPPREERVSAL